MDFHVQNSDGFLTRRKGERKITVETMDHPDPYVPLLYREYECLCLCVFVCVCLRELLCDCSRQRVFHARTPEECKSSMLLPKALGNVSLREACVWKCVQTVALRYVAPARRHVPGLAHDMEGYSMRQYGTNKQKKRIQSLVSTTCLVKFKPVRFL